MYLAIDPGKTTGWAKFNEKGEFVALGKITDENKFLDWMEEQEFKEVILERYRNRPGKINSWSDGPTQQLIGAIQRIAHKKGAVVHLQDPSPALTQGLRFIGMWTMYRGKHVPDDVSALAHGTYYLRKEGIQK